jgi:putative DNA primase/helicase
MAFINPGAVYTPDERGAAQRIADEWSDSLCWSEEWNRWLTRPEGSSTWEPDVLVLRTSKAMQSCERHQIAPNAPAPPAAGRFTRLAFLKASLELAKPLLAVRLSEFDVTPWGLNTPGGVVDLRPDGGQVLFPPESVTKRYLLSTRVIPERVETPLWDQHLERMTHGDIEVIAFLKRLAGITLIGDQNLKPHVSPQLNGLGRNGKGVFLQGLGWALGDYAQFASTRLLTTTENAHTTEQAGLRGMRLVVVEEVKRINSSLLKDLTGGGVMRARRMRADDEEFLKTWTLWFNNNGPMMYSGDMSDGLWQRVPRIDLGEGIPLLERIDDMAEQMKGEAAGVLQWALDGLAEYQKLGGLCTPGSVLAATEERKTDADPLQAFVMERYEFVEEGSVVASEFMRDYNEWAKATGEAHIGGRRAVYDELRCRVGLGIGVGAHNKTYIKGLKKRPMTFGGLSSEYGGLTWENN